MAIGSSTSGSAFSIGGKPLGVQLGGKSATDIFAGGSSGESLFAITTSSTQVSGIQVNEQQLVTKGIQDEIDRTLGYRTDLSVAEKQELADIQADIAPYNEAAQSRSLTSDELEARADLYVDAYSILGKDYVDIASDEYLTAKSDELTALMTVVPEGENARQLAVLEQMQSDIQDRVNELGDSGVELYYDQLRNIATRISQLTPAREIGDLTPEELNQHDELAEAINEYAGQELQITSDKRLKIERLQTTMQLVLQGGVNTII